MKNSQDGRHKTVIYITDEKISKSGNKEAAEKLRELGASVFAVGVGNFHENVKELLKIAGSEHQMFVRNIKHLNRDFAEELGEKVCHAVTRVKRFWSTILNRV